MNIFRVFLFILVLIPALSNAQVLSKEWWQDSEVEFGVDFSFYGSSKSADLATEPLQYLDASEDEIGLLSNEFSEKRPFNFHGYGFDMSESISPSEAISVNVNLSLLKPVGTEDGDSRFFIGPSLQYNGNHFGNSYFRNFSPANDNIYSRQIYFTESGKFDSLRFYNNDNEYDTLVLQRAKCVQLKNSSSSIQLGLTCKMILIKGQKRNVSLDIGAAKMIGLSNKVTVYSDYYDFRNTGNYHSIEANNEYYSNKYFTLLNNQNRSFQSFKYKAPLIHGTSFHFGFSYDRIIRNLAELRLGVSMKYMHQSIKRKQLLAVNRGVSGGFYVSKPIR